MTRVDFYILAGDAGSQLQRFACRLIDKARQRGMRCFVNAGNDDAAAHLDDLLWTFRDTSFIPHARASSTAAADTRRLVALIGSGEEPPEELELLINLDTGVPSYFSRFERVAEIVDENEQRRAAGRERFRYYRDRGYRLDTHKIQS